MKDRYIIIGIIALAVLVIGYAIWRSSTSAPAPSSEVSTSVGSDNELTGSVSSTLTAATTTPSSTQQTQTKPKTTATYQKPSSSTSLSATQRYIDALKIYKTSGYYFQFLKCHGQPGSLTIKKGKKFMLDNRDSVSHKIAFTGQSYRIGGYGFAIATAPLKPGTYFITCDGGGAASILVQP